MDITKIKVRRTMGEQEKKELSPEEEFGKAFDEITGVTPSSEEKVEKKEADIQG